MALDRIGHEVDWTDQKGLTHRATVVKAERTPSVIEVDGKWWPGVRFRMRLADGRHRWTCTFADVGYEASPIGGSHG